MSGRRTFNDVVLADLLRTQRLIERVNDEIDPQFRVVTPEGDYWIAMTLSKEEEIRTRQMHLLSDFMALKSSLGFVMVSELTTPDAVCAVGVTHKETLGALCLMEREPLRFGPVRWLAEREVGEEIPTLLPRGARSFTERRLRELDIIFGPDGTFPAVKIANE